MLKIKDFATLCGCSIYTLRYYDKIGLLKPNMVNEQSGYRYYTKEQYHQYVQIKEFQEVGFTVQEIKEMSKLDQFGRVKAIKIKIEELRTQLEKSIALVEKYSRGGK